MRRKIFLFLVVLGVLSLSVRFFVNQQVSQPNSNGVGIGFTNYTPLIPLGPKPSPLSELQNSVDQVSEEAMAGNWATASQNVQQLEQTWQRLRPNQASQLEIENDIEQNIQSLHISVWGKDQQGVLSTAQKLTNLIRQLTD